MKFEKTFYLSSVPLLLMISLLLGGREISKTFLLMGIVLSVIAMLRKISLHIYVGTLFLLVSIALTVLEFATYDNFLFSHYGIIADRLWLIAAIMFSLALVRKINQPNQIDRIFYYSIICLSVFYFQPVLASSISNFKYLTTDKHTQQVEEYGQIINFIGFLNKTLPKSSTLLIPPETLPWRYSGNSQLMGAWLYPVKVFTASDPRFDSLGSFDYLLISPESSGGLSRTWPDFFVHSEEIMMFDWQRHVGTMAYGDYDPSIGYGWGLIKVRKNNY